MKIKLNYLTATLVVGCVFSHPALAISEAYRAQLEKSGCTQVSEANGTCDIHQASQHTADHSEASHRHGQADSEAAREVAGELTSHLVGKFQGQAVDYMKGEGWKTMNDEHSRWSKAGFIAILKMSSSGKILGVDVY